MAEPAPFDYDAYMEGMPAEIREFLEAIPVDELGRVELWIADRLVDLQNFGRLIVTEIPPYPPAEPGTKYRELPFPVASPDRTPPEPDDDRKARDARIRAGLPGLAPPAGPGSPDELVTDWH